MVFFTCNGCGESLKKNKVDRHAYSCRNCEYVTCIDCSKDFWGNDFVAHNSCITEDEKYGATGFQKKMNKGDAKQQEWLKRIQDAATSGSLSKQGNDLLGALLEYDNIPRKKAKFLNFLKNSMRIYNTNLGEEVWEVFSTPAKKEPEPPATTEKTPKKDESTNGSGEDVVAEDGKPNKKAKKRKAEKSSKKSKKEVLTETATNEESTKKSKKSKKRKATEEVKEEDSEVTKKKKSKTSGNPNHEPADDDDSKDAVVAFPWNKTFRICVQSADGEISLKKLKKKVLAEYKNFQGEKEFRSETELEQLFTKKLHKSKKIKVEKTRVVLAKS